MNHFASPPLRPETAPRIGSSSCRSPPALITTTEEGKISIRVDQPVERCDVSTHAFFRSKDGHIDDNEVTLHFRWFRSQQKQVCSNTSCQHSHSILKKSKYECYFCVQHHKSFENAGFCSLECFRQNWRTHTQLYHTSIDETKKKNDILSKTDFSTDLSLPHHDIQWMEVNEKDSRIYCTTSEDVGCILKVECTPMGKNGLKFAKETCIQTNVVLPMPPLPPPREFFATPLKRIASVKSIGSFTVMSYNILSEIYATRQMYPYCPMWALAWTYRKQRIAQELLSYRADIICLQEAQADHFQNFLQPLMEAQGYACMYKQKTRKSMGLEGKVDGCACFYKRVRFNLKETHELEYNQVAARQVEMDMKMNPQGHHHHHHHHHHSQPQARRVLSRLQRDNVAQILILEVLPLGTENSHHQHSSSTSQNNVVCLANTHIFSNPEFPDVKLWQTQMLLKELEHVAGRRKIPILICGDFNSEPSSAVYELLTTSQVSHEHDDVQVYRDKISSSHVLSHANRVKSSYLTVFGSEPAYTNYTGHWTGVVDYIWYSPDKLVPLAAYRLHAPAILQAHAKSALPNCQFPSDHVPLCVEFQLK